MPGSNPLSDLFARSPIGPIQEHMQIAYQAAQLLPGLFRAAVAQDWDQVRLLQKEISRAEREADRLMRSVRRHLPKSLFLPVPRSDLLELVKIQDSVANTAKDIAKLVRERAMQFPEGLQPDLLEFVDACTTAVTQAQNAIEELDELLEVGFRGREVKLVEEMLKQLDKLERRTDKLGGSLRGKLFAMERELYPVDVMFLYRVLQLLGSLADDAEAVGDRLQVLLAR